jgi:hypothetical protein
LPAGHVAQAPSQVALSSRQEKVGRIAAPAGPIVTIFI